MTRRRHTWGQLVVPPVLSTPAAAAAGVAMATDDTVEGLWDTALCALFEDSAACDVTDNGVFFVKLLTPVFFTPLYASRSEI